MLLIGLNILLRTMIGCMAGSWAYWRAFLMRSSDARVGLVAAASCTKSAALGPGLDARGGEAGARAGMAWGWEAGGV